MDGGSPVAVVVVEVEEVVSIGWHSCHKAQHSVMSSREGG